MSDLPRLALGVAPLKREDARVYDPVRAQWVMLTPEEWVRQHAIHFLEDRLGIPLSLMAIEKQHTSSAGPRRPDLTVYSRDGLPWMILECKAASISISQDTLDQVVRYAQELSPTHIAVTNGMSLFCASRDQAGAYRFVPSLPQFPNGAQQVPSRD